MGERLRRQYAEGTRVAGRDHQRKHPAVWTAEQDDALRLLGGQYDCRTIARILTERFGTARSERAVRHRFTRLGVSRYDGRPLSSSEVGRLFGVSRETVRRRFVGHGYLVGTLRRHGPHGMRVFARAEIERLIREHPEAYRADAIRDPSLRALAVAVARGRGLVPTAEVTRLTGVPQETLSGWYRAGLVPSATKVRGPLPGAGGAWLIEAGDVETVRWLVATRGQRARERAEPRRCPLTGVYLAGDAIPSPGLRCTIRVIDRAEALARLADRGVV